jgi:hypothetical protein
MNNRIAGPDVALEFYYSIGLRMSTVLAITEVHVYTAESATAGRQLQQCHLTSNKFASKLECAEDEFQTRGWVPGREK